MADEERVAEIFVRINSEGVQLNQADFILTLMSVHWEKGRRELETFSRASVDPAVVGPSPKNPFLDPSPDQLFRVGVALAFRRARLQHVYSILRGKDLETWGANKSFRTPSIEDLIEAGESQTLEFKSTARWNVRMGQHDPRMEHSVVKTVCGFLNAEGGSLLIGVDDSGEILGLDEDVRTLGGKANIDGYELFLRQLLDTNLSVMTAATIRIRFHRVKDRLACLVVVTPSGKPVFARPSRVNAGNGSEFWVRIGNATKQMHGDGMVHYQEVHWG